MSLAQAITGLLWIQTLLKELYVATKPPMIRCDNQSTFSLPTIQSCIPELSTWILILFVRENVMVRQLDVVHIPDTYQLDDVFTKPLTLTKFLELKHKLKVASLP